VNLLLLGPQGSGKGTQATRIEAVYGIPHVSTGDLFRAAIAGDTALGREVEPILASGSLVPDELTIAVIEARLAEDDARDGFALDGFPRTLVQAEALDALLSGIGRELDAVLFFDVPEDVSRERLLERARIEGRADDTPEAIERRLALYREETAPVVEHYRATGLLVPLHADRAVDQVFAEIQAALDQVAAR
jgi:adenylate kinase